MRNVKTYTHTEEGRDVLRTLEHAVSTRGMEVYKCKVCDELFGGRTEEMKDNICGLCQMEIDAENYIPGEDQ